MKRITLGIALGLVLLSFVPACGATSSAEGNNAISVLAGAHRFREGVRRGEQQVVRLSLGRNLTPRNGLELHATLALRSNSSQPFPGAGGTVEADAIVYGLDYLFYFLPDRFRDAKKRFHPYLTAGIGGLNLTREEAHSDANLIVGGGIGMKYYFLPKVAFEIVFRRFTASFHEPIATIKENETAQRVRLDALITGLTARF